MKKIFRNGFMMLLVALLLVGCGTNNETQKPVDKDNESVTSSVDKNQEDENTNLDGHSVMIFCGAGMKDPFGVIAQQFQEATGCEVQVTYANAAQIQTQINTGKEGDFFIAGSKEEMKPVQDLVSSSKDLVQHIPVLAVASGNPKGITGPKDLSKEGIRFIMGDPEATPIGKIANKMIKDFDLTGKVDIMANTATAPAMATALEVDEADVALIWKENVKGDKLEIVDSKDMEAYIKIIPAALLSTTIDEEAQKAFDEYLDTQEVKDIWIEFGYEIVE
ncbi:molybdate ABC transporter substrate-binding protein [Alkalibaculum bacchi]|uniref:molybdate ABC transporter substrate-binding protein n=1 Tax=Alkalibaculum bacchi TaxID=645887 RepID=UPI0026F2D441|nr:molybdate ABC transporter substrate-binding protein [Alkalibaculum bacchi]